MYVYIYIDEKTELLLINERKTNLQEAYKKPSPT